MSMDITKKKGDKIYVSQVSINNGYDTDKKRAKQHLKIGKEYTIEHINVMQYLTAVKVVEVPDIVFNSVNFEN